MTDRENAREIVLDMLLDVIEGDKFCHTVLNHMLHKFQHLEKQERAFISRLCNGTVKHYITLDYIINQYASLPVRKMKPLIRNLLRLSVYQIFYMDQVPVSAICNEAVKLAKKRGFTNLAGFVNGILRTIARNKEQVKYPEKDKDSALYLEIKYSVPDWLIKTLLSQYDLMTVEAILSASLKEKETTIRCNQRKISPKELKESLIKDGITVEENAYLPYAFKITDYDYLEKLNTFQAGFFTVQDISSMFVCQVAGLQPQDFVVDVCAAPGGKTMHAAETVKLVSARDLTEYKIKLIRENIDRLGFDNIDTKVWDATIPDPEIIEKADIVIADLPCSGLGVLGKKADIKYKLSNTQLKELVQLQRKILSVVKDYVKPGGVLIYSTCTINQQENIENQKWFLKEFDFRAESLDPYLPDTLKDENTREGYLQLLPGLHQSDGFFLSRLRKGKKQ
ncbi:MAG: hypothetical protein K0S47_1503 [Herbinix sp.]|nr:hypothetical protein [Herbinix sp.]